MKSSELAAAGLISGEKTVFISSSYWWLMLMIIRHCHRCPGRGETGTGGRQIPPSKIQVLLITYDRIREADAFLVFSPVHLHGSEESPTGVLNCPNCPEHLSSPRPQRPSPTRNLISLLHMLRTLRGSQRLRDSFLYSFRLPSSKRVDLHQIT